MDLTGAIAAADEQMAAGSRSHGIPCVAYGLMRDGALVHVAGLDEDRPMGDAGRRPFRIASMSKSLTAATVLSLRDDGLLRLDDPLAHHLPWATTILSDPGAPPITIRHLLTMTAGLPTDDPWGDRQEPLPLADFDALVAGGLSFCRAPGLEFEYSNLGYALLGRVISAVTGEDFREAVRSRILEPLGMTASTYDVEATVDRVVGRAPRAQGLVDQPETQSGAFSPMGGLWSTVEDLARWVGLLSGAWRATGAGAGTSSTSPISVSSLREMQRAHVLARLDTSAFGQPHSPVASCYGMGLYVSEDAERGRFVFHSGGYPGYGSHMRWHPATGWAIIALGNRTYAPMGPIASALLDDIVADGAEPARRKESEARLWQETRVAMDVLEGLLVHWDDDLLDAQVAMNVDLDRPREERREEWIARASALGPARRVEGTVQSQSPAHSRWQVSGPGGTAWLEVLLSPERPPRIQSLSLSEVTAA